MGEKGRPKAASPSPYLKPISRSCFSNLRVTSVNWLESRVILVPHEHMMCVCDVNHPIVLTIFFLQCSQLTVTLWASNSPLIFSPYRDAVVFGPLGERVSYAQLIKIYESGREDKVTTKRYSPTKFIRAIPKSIWGNPDLDRLCTSHIERLNLSIRTQVKRLARLTLSFSKKAENLAAMMSLYFAFYNFVRPHSSLSGATPAMAHGIEKTFWTVEDLLRY